MDGSWLEHDGGRPRSGTVFIGGFVLGGLIIGTLGCVYAPQISKAIIAADGKELMRKLPKFIRDEEKALEMMFLLSYGQKMPEVAVNSEVEAAT
ncbi:unnamed protein product [Lupinus luteus]|uniref:Uncharacterized protein n=1 Tax=Lupinus luteus TaxID=3873 RepID=A0AAV1VR57_LUPLU